VQSDPTVENVNALISMLEEQTGSVIEELAGDVWADVMADGVAREAEVAVCGGSVTLVIDGTFIASATCSGLPKYQMLLGDQDFSLPAISVGEPLVDSNGTYQEITQMPEYQVHLENPKLVWINPADDPEIEDNTGNSGMWSTFVSVGGQSYYPTIRISGYYIEQVTRTYYHNNVPGFPDPDGYAYGMFPAPVGLRLLRRTPGTETDPPALGTVSGAPSGALSFTGTEYATPVSTTAQGDLDSYRLTTIDTSYLWPQVASNTVNLSEAAAWADFKAEVDAYNTARTPYQPELTANDVERSVTVSFMDRENSVYIRTHGCATSGSEALKYDVIAVNYGGYYVYQTSPSGTPFPMTSMHNSGIYALNMMAGIHERIIADFGG
jgi:hypothetical protein